MYKVLSFFFLCTMLIASSSAFARHRTHVTVYKQAPSQPVYEPAAPLVLIPVIGMFYDLDRRINCGVPGADYVGGPGFPAYKNPVKPIDGNVMIPAWQRGECLPRPKRSRGQT